MTIIKSDKVLRTRETSDFYPTPVELCRAALDTTRPPNRFMNILDPGCGDGPWGWAAKQKWPHCTTTGIDIRLVDPYYDFFYQQDFLTDFPADPSIKYDMVVGNPPYKFAEEFVRKSYDLLNPGGEIIFLLRLAFLESAKRCNGLFKEMPLSRVHVSARRVSFTGNKKSDDTAYGIFVWKKVEIPIVGTSLFWLNWEYEKVKK